MKRLVLLSLSFVSLNICFCQKQKIQDPYSGIEMVLSDDKENLEVTCINTGSPADILNLHVGYRISEINGRKISEISDLDYFFRSNVNMPIQIKGQKIGEESFMMTLPRTSIDLFSKNVLTETELFRLIDVVQDKNYSVSSASDKDVFTEVENKILLSDNPQAYTVVKRSDENYNLTFHLKRNTSNSNYVTILRDNGYTNYKTYDFDFISQEEPLTEKSLLNKLESYLQELGMMRNIENPDILILISFYSGQKEYFVPPQQIISTKIQNYFNWYWGNIPVPVTESKTREGYTKISYLTNISMKFLDFKMLTTSETPPVVWSASYSEISSTKTFLTDCAEEIYNYVMNQFPVVIKENSENVAGNTYTYTGIIYDKDNFRIIADVIPGSPAFQAGLRKGDEIVNINDKKLPETISSDKLMISWGKYTFSAPVSTQNAMTYLFNKATFKDADSYLFRPLKEVNDQYLEDNPLSVKVKRNGKNFNFVVKPQYKNILYSDDIGFTIN